MVDMVVSREENAHADSSLYRAAGVILDFKYFFPGGQRVELVRTNS